MSSRQQLTSHKNRQPHSKLGFDMVHVHSKTLTRHLSKIRPKVAPTSKETYFQPLNSSSSAKSHFLVVNFLTFLVVLGVFPFPCVA